MKLVMPMGVALAVGSLALPGHAQQAGPAPQPIERQDALDPSPVDPATDPDNTMFLGDWHNAVPRTAFGGLVFRDILTPLRSADPLRPLKRGAVLTKISAVSRATLPLGASAAGRMPAGTRATFYTSEGGGNLVVNGRVHALKDGIGFNLTPDFDFRLNNTGTTPLNFYVRSEPIPADTPPLSDVTIVSRWQNDRRVGAHWMHICNGGPPGMMLCTVAPNTMPQPHSHNYEELWLLVKGESVLMLGKQLIRMRPGQAYKIPPNGLVAHSNLNLGAEPIQMLYMGPAVRGPRQPLPDFAQLENTPIDPGAAPDIDMFIGNWHDSYPRIAHGNIYMRDILTGLTSNDPVRPVRGGGVLLHAEAISHAMLEPGATAHNVDGELKVTQEVFIVDTGTGILSSGGRQMTLSKGAAFIIRPDSDFRLTATGDAYLTFYVITEKLGTASNPSKTVQLIDRTADPVVTAEWHNVKRPVLTAEDGLSQYSTIEAVTLQPMAMGRPSSAAPGTEEIWISLDYTDLLLGKQLRRLPAGTAYKVPATGITAHSNINLTDKPARFLHVSTKP